MAKTTETQTATSKQPRSRRGSEFVMKVANRPRGVRAKTASVRFGSVELKTNRPEPPVVEANILRGREALAAATAGLREPGVKIVRAKGVAFYGIDPRRPDLLVRTLDGKVEYGKLVSGTFQVVPRGI